MLNTVYENGHPYTFSGRKRLVYVRIAVAAIVEFTIEYLRLERVENGNPRGESKVERRRQGGKENFECDHKMLISISFYGVHQSNLQN